MNDSKKGYQDSSGPLILKGMVKSLTIYEVTEQELENMANGEPATIHLNFSIGLISWAFALMIALFTVDITSNRIFYSFVSATATTAILGFFFFVSWLRQKGSVKKTVNEIKNRAAKVEPATDFLIYEMAPFIRKIRALEDDNRFLSVKWLREKIFAGDQEAQEALQISIEKGYLQTYQMDNPRRPKHPVTCCRLNRNNINLRRILEI